MSHPKLIISNQKSNPSQKNLCKTATKIDKTKILMTNGSFMKVESIAECSHLEHSAILLTCIKRWLAVLNRFYCTTWRVSLNKNLSSTHCPSRHDYVETTSCQRRCDVAAWSALIQRRFQVVPARCALIRAYAHIMLIGIVEWLYTGTDRGRNSTKYRRLVNSYHDKNDKYDYGLH